MALEDDVEGYWKLDEASGTRVDSSPNGRDLTDTNTVTAQAGLFSNAAEFARANLERLARTDLGLRVVGDITVQAWVKITSLTGFQASYGSGVVAHMTGDTAGDYWLGITDVGRVTFAHWETGGADADGRASTSGIVISVGSWHHILARRLSGVQTIWVNGVSAALAAAATTDSGWGTNGFNLGANWVAGGGDYHFNGLIEEPVVWSRGLSDSEIAQMYNAGVGRQLYSAAVGQDKALYAWVEQDALTAQVGIDALRASVSPDDLSAQI